jgi:chitin disaccharide deacetylase
MDGQLIINADDFGLCRGVNKGIAEAHATGVLTSATLMANMPAAEEAVEIAHKLSHLGVGVHLNLTEGKPLSQDSNVNQLLDEAGNFAFKAGKLALVSLVSAKVRSAVETELAAQIQWVIERAIMPTHLDSHKHIHSFPLIFKIVCRLAKRFGIPAIRYTYEPGQICRPPWPATDQDGKKRAASLRLMAKINRWQNPTFFKTDALLGVAHTGNINIDFFKAVSLYNTASIAEIMTHPGYTDGLDAGTTRLVKQRQIELEALCSEKTKRYFKEAGIKLVHYGQL